MNCASDTIVLAVDGGGTHCRIAASDGAEVRQIECGAANVSTDFDAACAELKRGLAVLADQVGLPRAQLLRTPVYLGLAGITGRSLADRLAAALPCDHVKIEDDRPSALRGALGSGDGFVAHCGTGSFLAAQRGGRPSFAGGWGPVLGDQASAQWIGRRALSKALESHDGLTVPSDLAQGLLKQFDGTAGIVRTASSMSPTEFGALAPLVTQHAGQGDQLAISILQAGADYLADRMIRMGWTQGLPICLTGGIGPQFATYLPDVMQQALIKPLGNPMSGAIALAHAFREEIEHERC